jgi:hypothetical protein
MGIAYTPARTRHQAAVRVRMFMRDIDAIEEARAAKQAQVEEEARRDKRWIRRLLVLQYFPLLKGK